MKMNNIVTAAQTLTKYHPSQTTSLNDKLVLVNH